MNRVTLFRTTPRIVFGSGAINQLPSEIKSLGGGKVFLITDKGIVNAGLARKITDLLDNAKIKYSVFDAVEPDPRYEIVEKTLRILREEKTDLVLGLGGGSSIDIAKTTAALGLNRGPVSQYFGIDLIPKAGLPSIIIPTTAGTGSEVTPIAILSDEKEKLKKGIVSSHLFPSIALLDPDLTIGLPPNITASTGMDALIHAIEAYTSVNATSLTDLLAYRAMELLYQNIRAAYANGSNLEARSAMLEGSLLAGMAFANAGVTAVHAFAYPIGAEFHIPHGVANTLMLPHVMRFNLLGNVPKFARIAAAFGIPSAGMTILTMAEKAVEAIERLADDLKVPRHLKEFGIRQEHIPQLAEGVMKVTRLLANNPRTLTLQDAQEIYKAAL
ncbi:MAG: iron-containing alcohol dehydrogenase [Deltaproteobacteria bacterium]|nr:iron-containing alcohol dehydrogenase [Deltaproteobacteria bacterium]MBW2082179.1 iron-containing alcohol dehydrogenase [Deltaproteobacteria bacterium]HDM10140.1 iron-containing alcohol dehydrogenase [Desulfobacteraceae bacterium]